MNMTLVLSVFINIPFSLHYCCSSTRDLWRLFSNTCLSYCISYIVVSSAYKSVDATIFWSLRGRSLINIKNKSGPRLDPCGTPQVIFSVSDFECLMDTFCVRVDKYDLNQDKALFPHLYISSFFKRTAWSTRSKAFWKSIITQPTNLPSFIAFNQESIKRIKADSDECPALKPLCFSCSNLLSLR